MKKSKSKAGVNAPRRAAAPSAVKSVALTGEERTAPTSYDVAELAGVSQSAVSRCFRPGASISEDKRTRILAAARRLGYAPDAIARSLSTRRSNLIGVIISNLTNLYYPEVLSEFNARCAERNLHILLFTVQHESDVDRVLSQVWQYRLDGVIVAARLGDAQIREFKRRRVPLVFYNRYQHEPGVNAVCCDQLEGAQTIIDGLVAAGHKRFGLIGGPPDSVVGAERVQGCITRLRHHGVKSVATVAGDYTYAGGRAAFDLIVQKLGSRPDAIVAANDAMALGCLDAIRFDHGFAVPKDISVAGFDGVEPGSWAAYQLAAIRQPVQEMAAAAVNLLLECVENPDRRNEKRVFSGTLVPGRSARLVLQSSAARRDEAMS